MEGFVFPVKSGVFGVRFFPVHGGEYKVSVQLDGEHIANSPFVVSSETQVLPLVIEEGERERERSE
jgi:Filamin/ABP280 repeat